MEFLFTDIETFILDLLGIAGFAAVLYWVVSPVFFDEDDEDDE